MAVAAEVSTVIGTTPQRWPGLTTRPSGY